MYVKTIYNEIIKMFLSTLWLWVYYLLAVVVNPFHPYESYSTVMIIGSFFGLPILTFIVIPLINARMVNKGDRLLILFIRTIIYMVIAFTMLSSLFTLHMAISNDRAMKKIFSDGVEIELEHATERLQNLVELKEIIILSSTYEQPYHKTINAGNMSGTSDASLSIYYEYPECGLEWGCEFYYKEMYDRTSGELKRQYNSLESYKESWMEPFLENYVDENKDEDYIIFKVVHVNKGLLAYLRRFDPYFDIIISVQRVEPNVIFGEIIDVNDIEHSIIGKRVTMQLHENSTVTVTIGDEEKETLELIISGETTNVDN